jgi:hypothetical protein
VTPILFPAGGPGAKWNAKIFLDLVVDLGEDDFSDVSLELTSVVEDALALGNDLVSNFGGDLGAKGLTASAEIFLDKSLPDHGGDPFGALKGSIEDLQDEVVDALLHSGGEHDAAQVC